MTMNSNDLLEVVNAARVKAGESEVRRNDFTARCQREEIAATDVVDPLYGNVKAWPAGAWMDCHGVDIKALFGAGAA